MIKIEEPADYVLENGEVVARKVDDWIVELDCSTQQPIELKGRKVPLQIKMRKLTRNLQ